MSNDKCRSCEYGGNAFDPDFPPCLECKADEEANAIFLSKRNLEDKTLGAELIEVLNSSNDKCSECPSYGRPSICNDCTDVHRIRSRHGIL